MTRGKETKLGREMKKAGIPYCYTHKGWLKHCESCIKNYKKKSTCGKFGLTVLKK